MPFSDPSFRGWSRGSRPLWIMDIRINDGKAWFQGGAKAPPGVWRRAHSGKRLGN